LERLGSDLASKNSNQKVIVVGLGAHGSSTAYQLAKRGVDVIGIDQFRPPHSMGSSHGPSRILRMAYKEGSDYVPLLRRSFDLWHELNDSYSEPSFQVTGGLFMGQPTGRAMTGMQTASREQNVEIQMMTPSEVREKYPSFLIPDGWEAIWDPNSGAIFPEVAVAAHLNLAAAAGADLRFDERVEGWSANSSGVTVKTSRREYEADAVILTSGVWMPGMLGDLELPFDIERVSLWMIEPRANHDFFRAGTFPNASFEIGEKYPLYMQANFGTGVKMALDHHGTPTTAETVDRTITKEDHDKIFEQIRRFVPDLDGRVLDSAVCMYTNTPDLNFVVDKHPAYDNVIIGSACSGHGFKFAPVMGEILADLALDGQSQFDLEMFSATRF
jgi:sarcosine oxidase